jgi:hypothetical protein
MIHDLKALLALGKVNTAYIHDALELALRVVAQEGESLYHARRRGVQCKFVFEDGELLDEFWQALGEV